MDDPWPIEMVRGKFMLLKSFFVYCKQFPVTVAYAMTIHKCQGLSLDCAIVDLSDNIYILCWNGICCHVQGTHSGRTSSHSL